jgi:hypothetical protein
VKGSSKYAELDLKLAYNSSTDVAAVATNPRSKVLLIAGSNPAPISAKTNFFY